MKVNHLTKQVQSNLMPEAALYSSKSTFSLSVSVLHLSHRTEEMSSQLTEPISISKLPKIYL